MRRSVAHEPEVAVLSHLVLQASEQRHGHSGAHPDAPVDGQVCGATSIDGLARAVCIGHGDAHHVAVARQGIDGPGLARVRRFHRRDEREESRHRRGVLLRSGHRVVDPTQPQEHRVVELIGAEIEEIVEDRLHRALREPPRSRVACDVVLEVEPEAARLTGAGSVGVDRVRIPDHRAQRVSPSFSEREARVLEVALPVLAAGTVGAPQLALEVVAPFMDDDVIVELVRIHVGLAEDVQLGPVPVRGADASCGIRLVLGLARLTRDRSVVDAPVDVKLGEGDRRADALEADDRLPGGV